jgi:hypothetical protein
MSNHIATKVRSDYDWIMSTTTQPTRPGAKPEIDDETRRIIEERLRTADQNTKQGYIEALDDVLSEGRKEVAQRKHPTPR